MPGLASTTSSIARSWSTRGKSSMVPSVGSVKDFDWPSGAAVLHDSDDIRPKGFLTRRLHDQRNQHRIVAHEQQVHAAPCRPRERAAAKLAAPASTTASVTKVNTEKQCDDAAIERNLGQEHRVMRCRSGRPHAVAAGPRLESGAGMAVRTAGAGRSPRRGRASSVW